MPSASHLSLAMPAGFIRERLAEARAAVQLGRIEKAEAILLATAGRCAADAAWLNLMGVVCESRGDWRRARRFYGKAMRADRTFLAAERNMRRWYELSTYGRTEWPVGLGDEADASPTKGESCRT